MRACDRRRQDLRLQSRTPNGRNHSAKAGLVYLDKHTQPDPGQGAWCLDNLLHKFYGQLDPMTVLQQVVPIYQTGDSQVAVYDFDNRWMYATYPSASGWPHPPSPSVYNVTKAYDRQAVRFDMAALFAEAM